MNQKSDNTKLVFFSECIIYEMTDNIENVARLVNAGKITPQQAEKLHNDAAKDLHAIFWAITAKISNAKHLVRAFNACRETMAGVVNPPSRIRKIADKLSRKTVLPLDTSKDPDYNYQMDPDDDLAMNAFKVQSRNALFGFDAPNPSDSQ